MDCKVDRKQSVLHIHHFALEPSLTKTDAFLAALEVELAAFLQFNRCDRLEVHQTSPSALRDSLRWDMEMRGVSSA